MADRRQQRAWRSEEKAESNEKKTVRREQTAESRK
jgi:hypothetical protein